MRIKFSIILVAALSMLISACGTAATPAPLVTNTPTSEFDAMTAQAIAARREATSTPTAAPTNTPAPATATPAAEAATATPEATEEAAPAANDPVTVLVSLANAERGQELFNAEYNTNAGPYKCSTCHNVESESMLIGPGLYLIKERGATRVEGESAAQYLYNSITNPGAYIVSGYVNGVMPQNYHELMTDDDVYNIIAYLFTLE